MKKVALFPILALIAFLLNSCCNSCTKNSVTNTGSCPKNHVAKEVTEWVDEEVYADSGSKGGKAGTVTQRRQVTKVVCVERECPDCHSYWSDDPACCDLVGDGVYARATAQGGTGEPHIGLIPTMRILAE